MSWHNNISAAESLISSGRIPPSEEIIVLIKRVNPTSLDLTEIDKERGYSLKGDLQNLLLENYGESFYLVDHPYNDDIVLIKHHHLPSIDACHADVNRLSIKALGNLKDNDVSGLQKPVESLIRKTRQRQSPSDSNSPSEALSRAEQLLDEYDYDAAREILAAIRINSDDDLSLLLRASRILLEEVGSYDAAIEMLLSQTKSVVKNKKVRELLALTYKNNDMTPEARAIFESIPPGELGKEALYAYADICFKDANYFLAFTLLNMADEKDGFVTVYASLRKDIEKEMRLEAEPILHRALKEFDNNELKTARDLGLEALAFYPNYHEARELVRIIDAVNSEVAVENLWKEFENSDNNETRLASLEKLLELDKNNRNKIKDLIRNERDKIKNALILDRLNNLPMLTDDGRWAEAFDMLRWLSSQGEEGERYRYAFSGCPYFTVLHENKRLQRLPEHRAKTAWLSFVKAKQLVASGNLDGCFIALTEIKPYFQGYTEFDEEYRRLYMMEQEKVRSEVKSKLVRIQGDRCTFAEVEKISYELRKLMQLLPGTERESYIQTIESRLEQLKPSTPELVLLEEYRELRLIGHENRAESIRGRINDFESLKKIDGEIAETFQINVEPLHVLEVADMPVNLANEADALTLIGSIRNEVILRQDGSTIIILNPIDKRATKYHSAQFNGLRFCDYLPSSNSFLFSNGDTALRAILCSSHACFTAKFDLNKRLSLGNDEIPAGLFMSSERTNDYYYQTITEIPKDNQISIKTIRKDINLGINKQLETITRDHHSVVEFFRILSEPDKFIMLIDGDMNVYDKQLKASHNNGIYISPILVDAINGYLYVQNENDAVIYDSKCNVVKEYNSILTDNYCIYYEDIVGFCLNNKTALISSNNHTGYFYKFEEDIYSNKFNLNQVICNKVANAYYCYGYNEITCELRLRDITNDLDELIEWQPK